MQLNKYILTSALVVSLAFFGTASASTALIVGNTSGAVGEQIDVPITITNPANTAGASFTVTYDTTALQLDELNSDFFPLFTSMGIPSADPFVYEGDDYYRAVVGSMAPTGAMIAAARTTTGAIENTLFTLSFTILAGATEPTYGIGVQPSIISNTAAGYSSGGEPVPMLVSINGTTYPEEPVTGITQGTVTISGGSGPGDSDGDGIPDQWERDNVPAGVDPALPEALDVFSATGDYDHDGYTDLVEFQNDGTTDPTGMPFSPTFINAPGGTGYDVTTDRQIASDFNGDGTSDFIARNTTSSLVYTYNMTNSRIVSYRALGTFPAEWEFVGTGDFNGDGTSDFLARNTTNDMVYTYTMSDSRIVSYRALGTFPAEWEFVGVGDFNGDGTSDFIARNTANDMVYTYNMSNSSIVSYRALGTFPAEWEFVGTGDFNADGTSDFIARNTSNDMVYAYNMSNYRIGSYSALGTFPINWKFVGTGDYNGDGTSDLMARNTSNGWVYTYNMSDSRIVSYRALGTFPANWDFVGTGDYNGDGTSDFMACNSSNGWVYTYNMSGSRIVSYRALGTFPADWEFE